MKISKPTILALELIIIIALLLLTGCSPQKSSGDAITANVVAEKSQGIASQSSPASVLGNIEHKKEKEVLGINSQIISSELLSNEKIKIFSSIKSISYFLYNEKLKVKFQHNSNKDEQISVNGSVKHSLSKSTASPGEDIELTVSDWSTEYFELAGGM